MRHKWADLIHAWAEGAEIEYKSEVTGWSDVAKKTPSWNTETEYRIKPEKKPDVVRYTNIYLRGGIGVDYQTLDGAKGMAGKDVAGQIKYVIDGETGNIKSVEALNANS